MSVVEKYTTIKNPGAYSGISGFKKNNKFSDEEIKKDLLGEDAYTLHVPVIKKFEREKFMVFNIDNTWQIDLADVSNLKNKSFGQNYGFLFCAVDTLSRYAWVQPIKTKHASETRDALEKIFKDTKRRPKIMYSDSGNEFKGEFTKYLKSSNIIQKFTKSVHKASIAERFNRTLKEKLYRIFTKQGNKNYVKILQDLLYNYNHSFHGSIKATPASVSTKEAEEAAFKALYGDFHSPDNSITFKFKIGDYVRTQVDKSIFSKGYVAGWTKEIFVISQQVPTNPPKYIIKDLVTLEEDANYYYTQELQKVTRSEFPYDVLEVVDETRDQILVKKINSDNDQEQWISKKLEKDTSGFPPQELRRSEPQAQKNRNA